MKAPDEGARLGDQQQVHGPARIDPPALLLHGPMGVERQHGEHACHHEQDPDRRPLDPRRGPADRRWRSGPGRSPSRPPTTTVASNVLTRVGPMVPVGSSLPGARSLTLVLPALGSDLELEVGARRSPRWCRRRRGGRRSCRGPAARPASRPRATAPARTRARGRADAAV